MADEFVTVGTYWDPNEANLAKLALERAGIEAFLEGEHVVSMAPYLANAAGVKPPNAIWSLPRWNGIWKPRIDGGCVKRTFAKSCGAFHAPYN